MAIIEIPKYDSKKGSLKNQAPCWIDLIDHKKNKCKPDIVCQCGTVGNVGDHHVHKDGMVTASFYHSKESPLNGCGWHVFLKLKDYHGIEFKPEK